MRNALLQNVSIAGLMLLIFLLFGFASVYSPSNEAAGHVASVHYETCDHCKIELKEDRGFWDALRSDPVAFFTMTLFLATVGLAWITIGLYKEAKRASAEQSKLTQDALRHADRSAKAAEDALVASTTSGKIQLRAYIGIGSAKVIPLPKDGRLFGRAQITIKNEGCTPAHEVQCYCGMNSAEKFDNRWHAFEVAGVTYIFPKSKQITKSKIIEITLPSRPGENIQTFVHGRIEYKDVFGETKYAF